jgi:tetratricopeptide (TPR) repeat protein
MLVAVFLIVAELKFGPTSDSTVAELKFGPTSDSTVAELKFGPTPDSTVAELKFGPTPDSSAVDVGPNFSSAIEAQDAIDPALRAVVEKFYATQEAEDVAGYLALWSPRARRPDMAMQLKFIFDSGDDKFSDLEIQRAVVTGNQARVRVRIMRARTDARVKRPDGSPTVFNTRIISSLTFMREGDEWKLIREGTPIDELAFALIEAKSEEERNTLLDAEPDLHNQQMLDAMSRPANALVTTAQYGAALKVYETVLSVARRIGLRKAEAQALQNIANGHYLMRQFDRALQTYEQELTLSREIEYPEGIAAALVGVGTIRYSTFEYPSALESYRQALEIQQRLDDKIGVGTTLVSIGNIEFLHGNYDEAVAEYRRSRDLFHTLAYTGGENWALEGLGRVYSAQGNLGGALEAYGAVLADGRAKRDNRGQGTALQNIGQIHLRLGNLDVARLSFEQGRTNFETMKDLPNVGFCWQGMALADLMAGRFAVAEKSYGQSIAACTAGNEPECAAHATVGLAFAQASQDHFDEAIASYRKGIDAFVKLEKPEATARAEIGLSQALLGKKDFDAAAKAARRARDRGTALESLDLLWRAYDAEARAVRGLGDTAAATALANDAIAAIERLEDARMERPGTVLPSDTTSAFALLAILQASGDRIDDAFATAERRRVHLLRVLLANNEREIYRGMTDAERAQETALVGELVSLHARRDHEKALPKPDADRIAKLTAAIRDAADRRRAHQQRLFQRLPDLAGWRGLIDPAGPKYTAAPGTVVLQFVVDEDDLVVLVSGEGEPQEGEPRRAAVVVPVSHQALAERVARIVDPVSLKSIETWRKASGEVFDLMPDAIRLPLVSAKRVVVIPDDVLWRMPFEAMPIAEQFLADGRVVTYAGSLFALARAAAVRPAAGNALLAAGAPELPAATLDRLKSTAPGWTVRSTDSASTEIQLIAGAFKEPPPIVQIGAGATEASFRTQAASAALLHIAAPFRINGASVLFSSALLSVPPTTDAAAVNSEDDGALDAREVINASFAARLATFSDGGASAMRNAGAAAPIVHWAWLAAGVPSLLIPRWAADDAAANALLAEFYAKVRDGATPEDALRDARAALRRTEATAAPFYWAGWMLLGR